MICFTGSVVYSKVNITVINKTDKILLIRSNSSGLDPNVFVAALSATRSCFRDSNVIYVEKILVRSRSAMKNNSNALSG
jgi:hypothetical protein